MSIKVIYTKAIGRFNCKVNIVGKRLKAFDVDFAEDYNIILEIQSITRHPDYIVNFEPSFLSNDIAIFKVDDDPLAPVSKKSKFLFEW